MKNLFVLAVANLLAFVAYATPGSFNEDAEIPDLKQTSDLLPDGGSIYCGPTAAANVLFWFFKQGFKGITDDCSDKKCQYNLVKLLGSSEYFDIYKKGLADDEDMRRGLTLLLNQKSFKVGFMEYQGWGKYSTKPPSKKWLKQKLVEKNGVLLRVSWYSHDTQDDSFHRDGGHWETLVGFENDVLLVHDPAKPTNEVSKVSFGSPLNHGTLFQKDHQPIPAKGFETIERKNVQDHETEILEGVFAFKPERK